MQPTFRHVPPRVPRFSMQATCSGGEFVQRTNAWEGPKVVMEKRGGGYTPSSPPGRP